MNTSNIIIDLHSAEEIPTRNGFGKALAEIGDNTQIVALCGDLVESTRVQEFAEKYPERFFEIGVAEQNLMGVSAGLALEGLTAFAVSYAVFNPGRNWDQFRVSVCYNQANVKVIGCHSGISVGPDGATHQALEDIAITRCLPNLTVIAPCDFNETKKATKTISKMAGSVYMRLTRPGTANFTTDESPFEIGKINTLREGDDVTIIGAGPILYDALLAAEELNNEGIQAQVLNCHTIKPIESKKIIEAAKETGAFVTVEEHQIQGGVGSAICEVLAQNYPIPVEMVGMLNEFGQSGEPEELLEYYQIDKKTIIEKVKKVLKRK